MSTKYLREDVVGKKFFDNAMYPHGFHRSGDFSVRESDLLTQYGRLCSALESGLIDNPNAEDQQLLEVCQGKRSAETPLEKAWVKYKNRKKRQFVHLVESERVRSKNHDNDEIDDDVEADDLMEDALLD